MRYIISIGLLFLLGACLVFSCAKETDKTAASDPRLTNPYCNDPTAVNYNWGFPGKPDSTVCFYPTDVFSGTFELHDSVFIQPSGYFLYADTLLLTIKASSKTKMTVTGFCGSSSLIMTANALFVGSIDTLVGIGDSLGGSAGQIFCSAGDTINGTFTKDRINDSLFYISLQVASDTGFISTHVGTARRKS